MIAAEITTIKHQTGIILLAGAIEIGRRLKEARNLIPNGNWGKWLEESVKAGKLQKDLLAIKQSVDFKQVERLNKNLNAAYLKARGNKIAFLCESLDRIFKDLMWEMKELAVKDPEAHEVYRNQVIDFLTRSLKEKI